MEFWKRGFCVCSNDIVCSYQKYDRPVILDRCFSCEHYKRFMREMEKEDERVMDGIDRLHELRERFERGEISEEEYHKLYSIIDSEMSARGK